MINRSYREKFWISLSDQAGVCSFLPDDTIYNNHAITGHCFGLGIVFNFISTTIQEFSCYALAVANRDFVDIIEIGMRKSD
jgi:hypothetical protein